MLHLTNKDIFNILINSEDGVIYFPNQFNIMVDTMPFERNNRRITISVSGIIHLAPFKQSDYSFIGQTMEGNYEILGYTIDDVYPNKGDAQEMMAYLKCLM